MTSHKLQSFFWPESDRRSGCLARPAPHPRPLAAPTPRERLSWPHPADQPQLSGNRRAALLSYDRGCRGRGSRPDRHSRGRSSRRRRGMRPRRREKYPDHKLGVRRGGGRRRRHAGRTYVCQRNELASKFAAPTARATTMRSGALPPRLARQSKQKPMTAESWSRTSVSASSRNPVVSGSRCSIAARRLT